ncbi:MAG: hypothetical protein ACRDAM_15810 [Casimicrobium sp.]
MTMNSIPPQAAPHLPVLVREAARLRSPIPAYILAGQIDHETACPIKTKCWNPRVEFKTSREQGVGLGQITRVFGRFDAVAEMRALHRQELEGFTWSSEGIYDPKLQLRAVVLKNRDNHAVLAPLFNGDMLPALTAYNRGVGGVRADRRLCQVTDGCDPSKWTGHVANTCASGTAIIPGTRMTACQISRKYAPDVMLRANKYKQVALVQKGDAQRIVVARKIEENAPTPDFIGRLIVLLKEWFQ